MKITNLNLQAYESVSGLNKPKRAMHPDSIKAKDGDINGARFANILTKKEIQYLNDNFTISNKNKSQSANESVNTGFKNRIDILA